MNRMHRALSSDKLQLFVSLPANDAELARAAVRAGADGLKVHINVDHRASGNRFGPLAEYAETFAEIRSLFEGPLGIVPGGSAEAVQAEEIRALPGMGIDFYSIYAWHLPVYMLKSPGLARTCAVDDRFDLSLLESAAALGIEAIEASIVPGAEYGSPLCLADLLKYRRVAERAKLPVIVPSQRKIGPQDVPGLIDCGVKVLLVGAVAVGTTAESIGRSVSLLREAIDKAGG